MEHILLSNKYCEQISLSSGAEGVQTPSHVAMNDTMENNELK